MIRVVSSIALVAALLATPALAQQAGPGQARGPAACGADSGIECPAYGTGQQAGRAAEGWQPGQGRNGAGGPGAGQAMHQGAAPNGQAAGQAGGGLQGPRGAGQGHQMAGLQQGGPRGQGQGPMAGDPANPAGPQTQTQARLGPNGTPLDGDHEPMQQRLRLHAPAAN